MIPLGIIPARYGSSRFPGKPLADILGKPMIWHVYERSRQALEHVVVATDDRRIFETCLDHNINVVMTGSHHRSGTERCREAAEKYIDQTSINFDLVINIQGDEPLIDPQIIKALADAFRQDTQIATLIKPEKLTERLFNPNTVKVVIDQSGYAVYFSRQAIPFLRDIPKNEWTRNHDFFTHIGIYAYRTDVLNKIVNLPESPLEKAEKLEQLRWLDHGYKIKTVKTNYSGIGVDTQKDLEEVIKFLKHKGYEQF